MSVGEKAGYKVRHPGLVLLHRRMSRRRAPLEQAHLLLIVNRRKRRCALSLDAGCSQVDGCGHQAGLDLIRREMRLFMQEQCTDAGNQGAAILSEHSV